MLALALSLAVAAPHGDVVRGGPLTAPSDRPACIAPRDRESLRVRVLENEDALRRAGLLPTAGAAPPTFALFPIAGHQHHDLSTGNYVDLDPGPGLLDWDCTDFTYDGHRGNDTGLRTFEEQLVGVPVVAAAAGTVVDVHDGEFDQSIDWVWKPANYVIVSHGGGWRTLYWHLKKDSVAVSVGQQVAAGEQLGQVGSSGISTGPHLHFEVQQDFVAVEPFAGACGPADSLFDHQVPVARETYVKEFAFSRQSLTGYGPPFAMPRDGYKLLSDTSSYFWIFLANLPAQSTWRVVYRRPDGSVGFDSGLGTFGNDDFYRGSWWWWHWVLPELSTLPGDWTMELSINDVVEVAAPLRVVSSASEMVNRPPFSVDARLEPLALSPLEPIKCVVDTPLAVDDLDYDVLRYRYEWTVDGVTVRDVVGAGQADFLPAGTAGLGSTVACRVTPNDGLVDGPSVTAPGAIDCLTRVDVVVPATANLYAAGHGVEPGPGSGGAGTMPPAIDLPPIGGLVVEVEAVGVWAACGPLAGADGGPFCSGQTDLQSYDGISGIVHGSSTMFLAGVFVGADPPVDPAPPRLDFSAGTDFATLAPALNQTFFVGDGQTGTGFGAVQSFAVPAGATRLHLGVMDGSSFQGLPGWYDDNVGAALATVSLVSSGGPGDCDADGLADGEQIAWGCLADADLDGTPDPCESLVAAPLVVSMLGGTQTLSLSGGSALAGLPFLIVGTVSGTASGLVVDGITIPIVVDAYTTYLLQAGHSGPVQPIAGALDPQGLATATLTPPTFDPSLLGLQAHHAWVGIGALTIVFASTAEPVILSL